MYGNQPEPGSPRRPRTSCPTTPSTSNLRRGLPWTLGVQVLFVLGLMLLGTSLQAAMTAAVVLLLIDLAVFGMSGGQLLTLLRRVLGEGGDGFIAIPGMG
jgi:hypothetical protein